jgi:uncharacterized membrane protein YdbT with pleckstrin-like domain
MEEEDLVWEGQPSQLVNLGSFALCLLFAWMIFPLVIAAQRALQVHFTRYRITSERIEVTTGILSRRIEQLELYRVKDLSVEEPLVLRLAKLGNLIVRSSDRSHPVVVLQAIPGCPLLRDQLRGLVEKLRDRKRVRELDV